MATIEIISIDGTETTGTGKTAVTTAAATVKVTIGDEEFVQQIRGVPTKSTAAARDFLTAYATEYEQGLSAARAAEAGTSVVPDTPIADLVGQSLP
jgi:predicted RNase H-like nuclease